jgi:hypothetical protein
VLAPNGTAYVAIGDSSLDGRAIDGARSILEAAERVGLTLIALATQSRPSYLPGAKGSVRQEHLLCLAKKPSQIRDN